MKKIIKKICISLFIVMLSFTLFACNKEDSKEEEKKELIVSYVTNGGGTIEETKLSLDNLSTYVLPNDPVKEGYDFAGWYTDIECKNPFKGVIDLKDSLTLYAKWIEKEENDNPPEPVKTNDSIDSTITLKFNVATKIAKEGIDPSTGATIVVGEEIESHSLNLSINLVSPSTKFNSLNDFTAKYYIDLKADNDQIYKGAIYFDQGYVFLTTPVGVTTMKIKIGIDQLLKTVYEEIEKLAKDNNINLDEYKDYDVTAIIDEINKYLEQLGVSVETIKDFIDSIKLMLPTLSKEEKTYTYSLAQEQFTSFVDSLANFIVEHSEEIIAFANKVIEIINKIEDSDSNIGNEFMNEEYSELLDNDSQEGIALTDLPEIIPLYAEIIKNVITINKVEATLKTNSEGYADEASVIFDVKLALSEHDEIAISFEGTYKVNSYESSVDTSVLDNTYLDYTFMIIEAIKNSINPSIE